MTGIVIIGGGLAGGQAALTLREEGYEGPVTVLAEEAHLPYQRPPLSKGFLAGTEDESAVFLQPDSFYSEANIRVMEGTRATAVHPQQHEVLTDAGEPLTYEKLLIATGARPNTLTLPGAHLSGIVTLRTIDDSRKLSQRLREGGQQVVVVGGGWIGLEIAATARTLGNEVTVVVRGEAPLEHVVGSRIGAAFQQLHESHGVKIECRSSVEGFTGENEVTGAVVNGAPLKADLVVMGVGVTPNIELAEQAGIEVDNGILTTDAFATSADDVFAAGDVANTFHPFIQDRVRSEHWQNAVSSAKDAAKSMLGKAVKFTEVPYFFSDQYDLGLEFSGFSSLMTDAELVVRGDLDSQEYLAFWVREGKLVAGMNVNVWGVNEHIQKLITTQTPVGNEELMNPSVPLESLITE